MIVSIVREHHWPPEIIGGLFVDGIDYGGLEYWYEDCLKSNEKIKPKK